MKTILKALSFSLLGLVIVTGCTTPMTTSETASVSKTAKTAPSTNAIDKAHGNGKPNGRIWVVTSVTSTPHLQLGDAFRVLKAGNQIKLVPLALLKQHWDKNATFELPLIQTTGAEKKLCGLVEIDSSEHPHPTGRADLHGPPHIIIIEQKGDDDIEVRFFIGSDDASLSVEAQCQGQQFHGGTAHAQN